MITREELNELKRMHAVVSKEQIFCSGLNSRETSALYRSIPKLLDAAEMFLGMQELIALNQRQRIESGDVPGTGAK